MTRAEALQLVVSERARQDDLKAEGRFGHTCADPEMLDWDCFVILIREVGELAHGIYAEGDRREKLLLAQRPAKRRDEIKQIAAVALAWLERFDLDDEPPRVRLPNRLDDEL